MVHTVTFYRDGECLCDETIHNKVLLQETIGRCILMLDQNGTIRVMDAEDNVAINYTMVDGIFYTGRYSTDAYNRLMEEII